MSNRVDVNLTGFVPVKGEKLAGTYELRHVSSGKVYHGSTDNIERRRREHLNSLRRGDHHNHALQELVNGDPNVELVFHSAQSVDSARKLEQEQIDHFDASLLLNVATDTVTSTNGLMKIPAVAKRHSESLIGNSNASGAKHSDEWKANKSKQMAGNTLALGSKHSDETKRRYSEQRRGRALSPEHNAASAEGRTKERVVIDGVSYQNAAAAAKEVGLSVGGVKKRCRSDKFPNWQLVPK